MENFLAPWRPQLLSILRIMAGLMLFSHGTTKHLNFPVGPLNNTPLTNPYGIAGIFELIFGFLLVIGLFSRPSAFIMSGVGALAYFYQYASKSFYPIVNGGESAVLFAFALIYVAAAGPGPWSVDAAVRNKQ
jgi:putative oxidoreductase